MASVRVRQRAQVHCDWRSPEHAFKARPLDGKGAVRAQGSLDSQSADELRAPGARPARAVDHEPGRPFAREACVRTEVPKS